MKIGYYFIDIMYHLPYSIPINMQRIVAVLLIVILFPALLLLSLFIVTFSGLPIFFTQKRAGKNKIPFTIYKFRTMIVSAYQKKESLMSLNERTWPVFKIRNDPRFTKIGKFLSHTGLDELPQFINIVKGDMAFVGPRPLPVDEAENVPQKYLKRFSILPGITSLWAIKGPHQLTFSEWMELDLSYVRNRNWRYDLWICVKTIHMILNNIILHDARRSVMKSTH